MPSYGEEARRGFFMRGLGYYFTLGEHMDLTLTGGIYTLGSWEVNAASRYIKRYKYSGNLDFDFTSVRSGDKGDPDFVKQNTYKLQWTHAQDTKANPGSTFSASVNLSSSGYSKYSATKPQRHALDADQLVDIVLEELGGHALLALDEHGRVAELADGGDIGHAAQHIVQRI